MKFSEYIIPAGVREELTKVAKTESDALWRIARLCFGVYAGFKQRQEEGDPHLAGVDDYRVWRACGEYARKSADRIKTLATVAGAYPPERVAWMVGQYGEWDFGYYERTWRYEEIEQEAIFEFLAQVRDGEFPNVAAKRLGVGEFISSYEFYVRHLQVSMPPCPGDIPIGADAVFYGGLPFGAILQAGRRLREGLRAYMIKPKVSRFVHLVDEMESSLPEVMRELGLPVPVDNLVENRVE